MKLSLNSFTVSFLKRIYDKNPTSVNFKQKYLEITKDRDYIKTINTIRQTNDKSVRNELKQNKLEVFNVGGILEGGITSKHLISKNPVSLIDIDLASTDEAKEVKDKLIKFVGCFAFFIGFSASGKGIHFLLYGNSVDTMLGHKNSFDLLIKEFIGVKNDDNSTGVFTRKMYVGYDENPFFNENPTPWPLIYETNKYIHPKNNNIRLIKEDPELPITLTEKMLKKYENVEQLTLLTHICIGLELTPKEATESLQDDPKYSIFLKKIIEKISPNQSLAAEGDKTKETYNVEQVLGLLYCFRFNVITDCVEIKSNYGAEPFKDFTPITDYILNSLKRELQNRFKKFISVNNLHTLLKSDFSTEYNPIVSYFNDLDEWDGVDRISKLAETVYLDKSNDSDFFKKCLKKWLVGLVACGTSPKKINQLCLVFTGAQGIGKTSWFLSLIPQTLSDYIYVGIINPNNKDSLSMLSESLLIILDEMSTMLKRDFDAFKELSSRTQVKYRKPYARTVDVFNRIASFCGTLNNDRFLNDLSGNRRFLTFTVNSLNYKNDIDIDKLYAQALFLYKSGFKYWMETDEIKILEKSNEKYVSVKPEEELILKFFEPCKTTDSCMEQLSATDIVNIIINEKECAIKLSPTEAGKVLKKHNFLKLKSNGYIKYIVKQKHFGHG